MDLVTTKRAYALCYTQRFRILRTSPRHTLPQNTSWASQPVGCLLGKLFFYTAFVQLHRWVCAHVWHFHLLSKQWSCELGLGFSLRAARVHTHHIYTHAKCKRHVEKGLTLILFTYVANIAAFAHIMQYHCLGTVWRQVTFRSFIYAGGNNVHV